MTLVDGETNIYSIEVPAEDVYIIFNDHRFAQNTEQTIPTDGKNLFDNVTEQWSTYSPAGPTVTGDTEGEVSATFNPNIKFTGITFSSEFEHRYDAESNTYTVIIPPDNIGGYISYHVTLNGNYLNLIDESNTLLMIAHDDTSEVIQNEIVVDILKDAGYYEFGMSTAYDGYQRTDFYSNDGGNTWISVSSEVKQAYSITVNASEHGTVTANEYAIEGETVTLNVAPAEGYMVDTLTASYLDADSQTVELEITNNSFTMPAAAVTVNATFKLPPVYYNVTVNASENGAVTVDPDEYTEGETVTLNIAPTGRYSLASLIVSDGTNEIQTTKVDDNTYTFVMPAANVTVTATFEDVSAKITGVTLNVDGKNYTGAEGEGTVYITPTSQITVTIYGKNLQNATDGEPEPNVCGLIACFHPAYGTINEDGTEATFVSSPSEWTHECNEELVLVNRGSDDRRELDHTGIVVTYITRAGTDLTTIYFNNANAWETITATFYTGEDEKGDKYPLGTAELSLVGGESVIYSTSSIPKNAAYVTFSNGTETTNMVAIPMASANTAQYNMDGTWTEFIPTPLPVTSAEITWGSMSFTYDDTVDAATGEEKGWGVANAADAQVTVKNTGETAFVAEAGYASYEGYESITGSFTPASSELAIGNEYTFTLELDGKPKKALSGDKIGKVTITITKVEESE